MIKETRAQPQGGPSARPARFPRRGPLPMEVCVCVCGGDSRHPAQGLAKRSEGSRWVRPPWRLDPPVAAAARAQGGGRSVLWQEIKTDYK